MHVNGGGGEKNYQLKKKFFFIFIQKAQVKMTRIQQSTDPGLKNTQVMYRDVYKQL